MQVDPDVLELELVHLALAVVLAAGLEREQFGISIDTRALKALTRSPLAIDLYVWLTYRMSYLKEPTMVPWELLSLQTGAHYREVRQFRRRALEALPKVVAVYPDARVRAATDDQGRPLGLELEPSPTHVRHRPKAL